MLNGMGSLTRFLSKASVAVCTAAVLLFPAVAWAQDKVPLPSFKRSSPVWLGYLVMFVLLAAVILVSLMPSKRGHQD